MPSNDLHSRFAHDEDEDEGETAKAPKGQAKKSIKDKAQEAANQAFVSLCMSMVDPITTNTLPPGQPPEQMLCFNCENRSPDCGCHAMFAVNSVSLEPFDTGMPPIETVLDGQDANTCSQSGSDISAEEWLVAADLLD
eukprot:CAMPEP_0198109996 /NCGR_PEP_ID=MMETSP1442-20131203/2024_1 /TAXON_ID= /ORGANISM="Craspedostauros australis, Strain CCMP3328" /LENGTH=137 /DNA_ID=CAMNT_0043765873 /DNA_START=258 /DNA_END=672 /DNA_ORIENTATION=+